MERIQEAIALCLDVQEDELAELDVVGVQRLKGRHHFLAKLGERMALCNQLEPQLSQPISSAGGCWRRCWRRRWRRRRGPCPHAMRRAGMPYGFPGRIRSTLHKSPCGPLMRIDRLLLQNFKGFQHRELTFHPQFNLVVGENGTGKTSLLDALAVAAGSWFLGVSGIDTRQIYPYEVRLQAFASEAGTHWEAQYPCSIEASGSIGCEATVWRRSLNGPGGRTTRSGAAEIKTLAEQATRAVREGQPINLPLISYYGTGRLWLVPREQGQVKEPPSNLLNKQQSRLDGYKTSVDPRLSVSALSQWVARQSWLSFQQGGQDSQSFQVVRRALVNLFPGAADLHFDAKLGEVVLRFANGDQQPFMNLSDGQRAMLAVVGDLAQKAASLNPHLGADILSQTEGVVMIDELDLHLHPTWQRHVIEDLRTTFPKLQFICTTHSPFLIQSLRSGEELLMLEGQPTAKLGDLSIAEIAEGIQGVPDTSVSARYAEMKQRAKTYLELLEDTTLSAADKSAAFKDQLAESISPFADNPAFQALLELQKLARLGGD
jgi:predicted ATP-binding protein involved in virulence